MAQAGLQTILGALGVIFTTAWWRNMGYREIEGPRDAGVTNGSGYDSLT